MPSINDSRKTVTTTIPSIPGSEIVLWDSLNIGDAEKIEALESDTAKGMLTMICLIKSWNLDEPLNEENIKKLSLSDFDTLLSKTSYGEQIAKTTEEREEEAQEKKTA